MYNSFKFHRNALNKLTRLSKANHYRSYFEEKKIKVIKNWDSIKEITYISKRRSQSIKNLNVDDTITSNSKIIANNIKFKKKKKKKKRNEIVIVPTTKKYYDYLLNPCGSFFFISLQQKAKMKNIWKHEKQQRVMVLKFT